MATITKVPHADGTIHYKARIRRHGKQRSRTFTAQSDAKRWARRVEVEQEKYKSGLATLGSNKSLHQAIVRYRDGVLLDKKPTTQISYSRHLQYWDDLLGHLNLSDITGEMISRCRDELKPNRSPATVNRYLATLGSVLTASVKKWHWLASTPMVQVEKLVENNQRKRFLSETELTTLLRTCKESESPDLYPAVMLAITTGARQAEILGLYWNKVDLERQVIILQDTKNKDSRTLPIVDQVLPLLIARKETTKGEMVFPSKVSSNNPIRLRRSFTTALRRAGIEDFHWHDLRHSCASFLAKDGATLLEIGEVLGHRSTDTTKRYAHLTEQHSHSLVRGLANRLLEDMR